MASNFFERQDRARRRTRWLVLLFILASGIIVASTSGVAFYVFLLAEYKVQPRSIGSPWPVILCTGISTALIIILGSLFKVISLRSGGGQGVAERLGGQRILPSTEDPDAKRVLNIVEEMAIASGTPVPPVFLLNDEDSINAFAAGYSPSDAVIGVTRGAIEHLTREQLQGVIAHEFSHILNGDMRLGIRLIGILHGILLLNLMGRFLLQMFAEGSGFSNRRSKNDGGGNLFLAGILISLALIVIGFIGSLLGSLIKAAVSRQREHLADASAVQFTRNPQGLSSALKTIAAYSAGSCVNAPNAAEASHLFFAQGIRGGFASWLSTHPPLHSRILALEPSWDGSLPKVVRSASKMTTSKTATSDNHNTHGDEAGVASFSREEKQTLPPASKQPFPDSIATSSIQYAVAHVGIPEIAHQAYARTLIKEIPPEIRSQIEDPFGARAVVFALLADHDPTITKRQLHSLVETDIEREVVELTVKLLPAVKVLPAKLRLPIIDLAIPALKTMSPSQYSRFEKAVGAFMKADGKLTIFEWGLGRILVRHLQSQFHRTPSPRIDYFGLQRLGQPISTLLSAVARVGQEEDQASRAFEAAKPFLPEVSLSLLPADDCRIGKLEEAIAILQTVNYRLRGRLLDAAAAIICSDKIISPAEAELLRGVADMLESPMPPILPGQRLA